MRKPRVIGLAGYAQSGKDQAAEALAGDGWVRVSFADGVRESLYALNPYIVWWDQHSGKKQIARLRVIVDAIGWEGAKKIQEVRELLQRQGTEAGRDIHGEDCWVAIAAGKATEVLDSPRQNVIFTDVRFDNEAAVVHALGGTLVRVTRPGVGPVNDHKSDTGVENILCDETWENAGSLEEWREKVQQNVAKWSTLA